jgi:hypothetical protein
MGTDREIPSVGALTNLESGFCGSILLERLFVSLKCRRNGEAYAILTRTEDQGLYISSIPVTGNGEYSNNETNYSKTCHNERSRNANIYSH